jgi:hypothetical protein
MKKILIVLVATHFYALVAQGQSELVPNLPLTSVDSLQATLLRVEPQQEVPSRILPDDPIPVLPSLQDGPAPCPFGEGKSCALLGGRAYFSDPMHMTEHDKTFWKAATTRGMLIGFSMNLAATVLDIEGTEACLRANTCREANPLFGPKPSRARAYGTAIPWLLGSYAADALLKKGGKGNLAFGVLWLQTVAHFYFGMAGFATANPQSSPTASSATRQKFTIAIRF